MPLPESPPKPSASSSPASSPRDPAFTQFFTLVACFVGCATVFLTLPRAVLPQTLPVLMLDAQAVRDARDRDARVAEAALSSADAEALKKLHNLHLAIGRDEVRLPAHYDASLHRALWTQAERLSPEVRDRARIDSTDGALACLEAGVEPPEQNQETQCTSGLLGGFAEQLVRYGLRGEAGTRRAPEMSVRAAYKIRWNMLHQRPRLEGLARVEEQAFFGFVALHAQKIPLVERAQAAGSFYEAGGDRGAEAYAVFLFQGGAAEEARALLEHALEQRFELRLRNFSRGIALSLREADF